MKRRHWVKEGQPALELIEEGFYWLRRVPTSIWLAYLSLTLPLLLGGLLFWAEMSTSPDAKRDLALHACLLTALLLLAKLGQTLLCDSMHSLMVGVPRSPWGLGRMFRTVWIHLALQPLGLILIPFGLLTVFPAGWIIAWFQAATVLARAPDATPSSVARLSFRQARLWPAQNHVVLTLLSSFGLFVFINLLLLCVFAPQGMKMFLGLETIFSRSPWSVLNSTVLAALMAFATLAMDPLFKAIYVLRCFQGQSVRSGEDLLAGLHHLRAGRLTALLLAACLALSAQAVMGAETAAPSRADRLTTSQIDAAIDDTLATRDYRWRLPQDEARSKVDGKDRGWANFWEAVGKRMKAMVESGRRMAQKFSDLLQKLFGSRTPASPQKGNFLFDWGSPLAVLSKLLLVVLALGVVVLAIRLWKARRVPVATVAATPATSSVDLRDEDVHASQLPEDGWLQLAHNLAASGELRLSMRAFYLASLSHLASRNLLSLEKAKSNQDYLAELRRRSHALPTMLPLFSETVVAFECVWYGEHPVDSARLEAFAARVGRIQGGAL